MSCCVLCCAPRTAERKQRKAKQRKAESKAKLNQANQSNATQSGTFYESWHRLGCVSVSALLAVLCCVVSYCVVLGCAVSCWYVLFFLVAIDAVVCRLCSTANERQAIIAAARRVFLRAGAGNFPPLTHGIICPHAGP